ncbi:MAG: ADP-ribosylglycohydrolase family protein [Lachnospiraceae bacterium]|nr:ADP-ribosylglycohydrolase family protein [Lachnospiraceae bacterium]
MAITGAILGGIAGSQFEYDRPEGLNWENCALFSDSCEFTDDTVMSLAVKFAVDRGLDYEKAMKAIGRMYPVCGYGPKFFDWLFTDGSCAYNSFGNGAAMRVSYIGEHYSDRAVVKREAAKTAMVSHSHPEGVKGAVAVATMIWMIRHDGAAKEDVLSYAMEEYPPDRYPFSPGRDMEYLRKNYSWDVTCMTSVPVAVRCFYESSSYESFIRNVFSLDCDSDTICAIGGGIAEEFYGLGDIDKDQILGKYLDKRLLLILKEKNDE